MNYLDASHKQLYEILSNSLYSVMAKLSPKIKIDESEDFPILILESDLEVAGFGILKNQADLEFKKSYATFKKMYSQRIRQWSRSNISFVVCRPEDKIAPDDFFNEIETDLYFCRKYVISMGKKLSNDIERLPFVPLDKNSITVPKRPISAQSLIQKLGASADLSRSISKPNTKKSKIIAEECLREPALFFPENIPSDIFQKGVTEIKSFSRLKSLTINDFRAYKGKHVFNLDADLVILYGPNGIGKTSFFDAIDFVCTGGCGRFNSVVGGEEAFKKSAHHLDADPSKAFVELEIVIDKIPKTFSRKVLNPAKVSINGSSSLKDRTTALFDLTGVVEDELEKRVETIINLFRATHLFGQDFQTLTEEFGKTSALSLDIVSRMLAFQDYVRSDQKLAEIISTFSHKLNVIEQETALVNSSIKELQTRFSALKKDSLTLSSPESLDEWMSSLVLSLGKDLNFPQKSSEESWKNYLRILRSIIEGAEKKESQRLEIINTAQSGLSDFLLQSKNLNTLNVKGVEIDKNEKMSTEDLARFRKTISENAKSLADLRASEAVDVKKIENLNWLKITNIKFSTINKTISDLHGLKKALDEKMPLLENDLKIQENKFSQLQLTKKTLEDDLKSHKTGIIHAVKLKSDYETFVVGASEITKIESDLSILEQEIQNTSRRLAEKNKDMLELLNQKKTIEEAISVLLKNESELSGLIEKLKGHVQDGHCPACGTDHGTEQAVLTLLSSQAATSSKELVTKSVSLRDIEANIVGHQIILSEFSAKIKTYYLDKDLLLQRIKDLKEFQSKFSDGMLALGLQGNSDAENKLQAFIEDRTLIIDTAEQQLITMNKDIEALSIFAKRGQLNALKNEISELEKKVFVEEKNMQDLLTETARRGLNINDIEINIDDNILMFETQLKQTREKISELESLLNEVRLKEETALKKLSIIKNEKNVLDKEKAYCQKNRNTYIDCLRKVSLKDDVSLDDLTAIKNDNEQSLSKNRELLSKVIAAEMTIEASEVSAETARLLQEIKQHEEALTIQIKQKELVKSWCNFFVNMKEQLATVRNKSVSEYTEKYGPLSSAIQSRLRSVYGFGELHLVSSEGKILVTVDRSNEKLRPIDYFSESQKQILVLSLFFASAITQNWSSFSPIFLDDPVTHFDDLNAYAFLDLISGMLQSEKGHRQFVISTCEEKLFQLMRQKFYGYGERVKIYEFSAIGEKGPIWKSVCNGVSTFKEELN